MAKKVIGIDLASCFSAVAVIENGKPVVVVNEEGSSTTPSVISLKEGTPKVGSSAKRQMVISPKETVYLVKRFMGGTYDECKKSIEHVTYDVVNDNGRPRIRVNEKNYTPEELSAMIITKMKNTAEDYLGDTVTDAVITVPAFFSDAARSATKQAGELAGLNVLRVISEPTAALLASNIDKNKGGKYLVVDYGGATTDFSVADVSDNVIEILSSYGDVYCGGSDIDKIIAEYIVDEFNSEHGVVLKNDALAMSRIFEAAEKAKIELSSSSATDISLPYITAKDGTPLHLNTNITRAKFEQLISKEIEKVVNYGKVALERADMKSSELDGILLVGGSCRIPYLQEKLIQTFGDKLIKSANLDLVVAEGAAIQANIIANGEGDILLLDVCPISIGIETLGGVMTTLVEANTTIPCTREEIFTTAADNQQAVTINVLQGQRPMAKDNKQIGLFTLDGIMPAPKNLPKIKVKFDIDANSILTVTAIDQGTGREQHITIQNNNSLSKEEIERIKHEAEIHAEEDKKTRERLAVVNKLDSLVFLGEKLLEEKKESTGELSDAVKDKFRSELEKLKSKRDCETSEIEAAIKEFNNLLSAMEAQIHSGSSNPFPNGMNFGDENPLNDFFGANSFTGSQNSQNNAGNSESEVEIQGE